MGADPRSKAQQKRDRKAYTQSREMGPEDGLAHLEGERLVPSWGEGVGLEDVVRWASERCDGWLRIVPDATGEVHWKWRFTSGRWRGHYIYWAQGKYEGATSAFTGLAGKLDLVDQGDLKPSKDTFK